MREGVYRFYVHQYSGSARYGFRAEIEFNGTIYSFDYSKSMRLDEIVKVAEVYLDHFGNFTIKELLPSNVSSREIWGLKPNNFVPVTVVMYSPNYWDDQNGIGHRHYFFMLKDCINLSSLMASTMNSSITVSMSISEYSRPSEASSQSLALMISCLASVSVRQNAIILLLKSRVQLSAS